MTIATNSVFWAYRATRPMRDFGRLSAEEIPSGALVLVNPAEIQRMRDQIGYAPPEWVEHPPPQWTVEQKWDDAALYTARRLSSGRTMAFLPRISRITRITGTEPRRLKLFPVFAFR